MYTCFRFVPKSITLHDLETVCFNMHVFTEPATKKTNEDSPIISVAKMQANGSMILVCRNIWYIRIFVGVLRGGASNDSGVVDDSSRLFRWLVIYCKTNKLQQLFHVKLGFRASSFRLRGFDFQLMKTNKHRPIPSAAKIVDSYACLYNSCYRLYHILKIRDSPFFETRKNSRTIR